MGSSNSLPADTRSYPPQWLPKGASEATHEQAASAVRALSAMDPERFLQVRAPLPELEDTAWGASWDSESELSVFKAHAMAAVQNDISLNKLVYKCVPKRVPEAEFWRCFFCWAYHAVTALDEECGGMQMVAMPATPALSKALLDKGDDSTSNGIIAAFRGNATFDAFSKAEMDDILKRDAEDDEKLAAGIQMAVSKGVLAANPPVERLTKVDVLGKSAGDVASTIIAALGDAPRRGCVLVLQGLSGTGKGTTVAKLQRMLPRASAWSNGNIFRALTLLAVTYCESHGLRFGPEVLSAQLLAELMGCLHFEKKAGSSSQPGAAVEFDVRIDGLGIRAMVSQVANTLLKEPKVSQNIPTVAKVTQGEVIAFAAKCAETMRAAGCNVLMEGRAQTLNYVRTPHRFELILSKPLTIGLRRAAQRVVGSATPALQKAAAAQGGKAPPPSEEVVLTALVAALDQLTA